MARLKIQVGLMGGTTKIIQYVVSELKFHILS
jgi:hypothetical protein